VALSIQTEVELALLAPSMLLLLCVMAQNVTNQSGAPTQSAEHNRMSAENTVICGAPAAAANGFLPTMSKHRIYGLLSIFVAN